MGKASGIGSGGDVGNDDQRTGRQRFAYRMAVRQRHHRIGAHNPHRFHLAAANGGEQIHRRQPRRLRQTFGPPEARQTP